MNLIINCINFDHILNMEKVVLHTRIEEIWLQQKEREFQKWKHEMFTKTRMLEKKII